MGAGLPPGLPLCSMGIRRGSGLGGLSGAFPSSGGNAGSGGFTETSLISKSNQIMVLLIMNEYSIMGNTYSDRALKQHYLY